MKFIRVPVSKYITNGVCVFWGGCFSFVQVFKCVICLDWNAAILSAWHDPRKAYLYITFIYQVAVLIFW